MNTSCCHIMYRLRLASYFHCRSTRFGSASLIAVELEFHGQHTDSLFVFLYIIFLVH